MNKNEVVAIVRDAVRKHFRIGRFEAPDSHFTTNVVASLVTRCHLDMDTGEATWEHSTEDITVLYYTGRALPAKWAVLFDAMPLMTNNPGLSVAPELDGRGLGIDFIPDYERTMRDSTA